MDRPTGEVTHHLACGPQTVHWGYLSPEIPPVLTVESGDVVVIDTVNGAPDAMPDGTLFETLPEHQAIHREVERRQRGHILTGPVEVRGAKAGMVLEINILDVSLRQNWGWNVIRPGAGGLPDEFTETRLLHIPIDREAKTASLPWGMRLPLRPFMGVMGVAPASGEVSSIPPGTHGGNLDIKELVAGTTLYLPVFTDGALFSCGDGHAVQGDGEACITAIETALTGRFRLRLRPDLTLAGPQAETPTHYVTTGLDPDLDEAARQALRGMIEFLGRHRGLGREDAYTLCSLAADLRISQIVNGTKGVHAMIAKALLDD